jgi:hypothetical protein
MTDNKRLNSKNKGSNFERQTSKLLSNRFEKLLGIKNSFRKLQDSGSFFGGSNKQRIETYNLDYAVFGDIICPKNFKFSIECKHYKTPPTFKSIINQNVTQWDKWLQQALQDSNSSSKEMCLIVKYNNVDEIVFLTHSPLEKYTMYKNYYIVLLEDWLSLQDTYFFSV